MLLYDFCFDNKEFEVSHWTVDLSSSKFDELR